MKQKCPKCHASLNIADGKLTQSVKCPSCGQSFIAGDLRSSLVVKTTMPRERKELPKKPAYRNLRAFARSIRWLLGGGMIVAGLPLAVSIAKAEWLIGAGCFGVVVLGFFAVLPILAFADFLCATADTADNMREVLGIVKDDVAHILKDDVLRLLNK